MPANNLILREAIIDNKQIIKKQVQNAQFNTIYVERLWYT